MLQSEAAVRSGALIKAVVTSLQQTLHPMQVLKGGSAGKNTDVPGSDIDLVIILQDYNYEKLQSYANQAQQGLNDVQGLRLSAENRALKVGVSITVTTDDDKREIDLLFTGDPDMNAYNNPSFCYDCFHALEQCKYVKAQKALFPLLHANIIDFKIAAFEQRKGVADIKCPSYFIELLIIKDFLDNGQTPSPALVHQRQRGVYAIACPVTGATLDVPKGKSRDWWDNLRLS